jgi:hypothetical protein
MVRRRAAEHSAEPATREVSQSRPATAADDGGVGIQSNFQGVARFGAITWEDRLGHFDQHHLLFVFEEQDPAQVVAIRRASTLSLTRWNREAGPGGQVRAERDLREARGGASASAATTS